MSNLKITCCWSACREFWNCVAITSTNCANAFIVIIIIIITGVDFVSADHASKIYKGMKIELH